ncbi:aminopeptidase P family protein [Albibacterium sp.]|uniref:aminopeptidase P family protein n=1 Tax=Albibacterium sp. TaxID=2952885 RepID=UPI002C702B1A|nr:aminopeptidase P family protein [Albibacterium sp.]HUH18501.1 aminopeptidase P family protein [Albibacterium sp.]
MTPSDKLSALREKMRNENIDAYIITMADPHISEYLPDRYKNIEWISNFTGSAGTLVITANFAGLWTDSRYFVQATDQLNDSGFQLVKLKTQGAAEYITWLSKDLSAGNTLAFDGKLTSISVAKQLISALKPKGINIRTNTDLIETIWTDRPSLPNGSAYLLDKNITGKSISEKIREVQEILSQRGASFHLISSLDDISWIFNIRGEDIKCNPVVLSFALFTLDGVQLFIDSKKLNSEAITELENAKISIHPYEEIENAIRYIPANASIFIDPKRNCYSYYALIPSSCNKIEDTNPSTFLKSIKNETELAHTRETMIRDGIALSRFFYWLEQNLGKITISEITVAEKLKEYRAEQKDFVGESFDTIAGYKEHGALPHYKATPDSNVNLELDGLLLIDSGGQYITGTTDITRVISLGNLTDDQKKDYTLVLKAMIEGSTTVFPVGTRGYQIDAITRKPLWDEYRNYGHGTGHGVGFFLNVHEGPHVFNASNTDIAIEPHTITSIEPGLYREGYYGIRIENLVASCLGKGSDFGQFMTFETLTMCYIETSIIDKELLEKRHINWLNQYHSEVFNKLSPFLNEDEKAWLASKTLSI